MVGTKMVERHRQLLATNREHSSQNLPLLLEDLPTARRPVSLATAPLTLALESSAASSGSVLTSTLSSFWRSTMSAMLRPADSFSKTACASSSLLSHSLYGLGCSYRGLSSSSYSSVGSSESGSSEWTGMTILLAGEI